MLSVLGTGVGPSLWSAAEVRLGVVSGNIPSLKPLFAQLASEAGKLYSNSDPRKNNSNKSTTQTFGLNGFTRIPETAGESDPNVIEMNVGTWRQDLAVKPQMEQKVAVSL